MLTSLSKEILLKLGTYIVLVLQFASLPMAAKDGEYTTKTFLATFLISMIFFIYLFTHFFFGVVRKFRYATNMYGSTQPTQLRFQFQNSKKNIYRFQIKKIK